MGPEERYRLAFELSPVPLLLVSPDGLIRLVSRELEEMFEYPEGALINAPVECLLPEDLRAHHPELRSAFGRFPTKRRMGEGRDLKGVTRDGKIVPLELGLQPVEHKDENWVLVTAIDTSVRSHSEELARATLDAAASAMVMVSKDGKIVSVNPATNALFGYADGALIGDHVEILLPEHLKRKHVVFRNSFFVAQAARSMGAGEPLAARHSDGTEFPIEAALTPIELGKEKFVLATIIDLSERIAAQRAAEAHASRLAMLNDELTRFAYSASHDLKAPLSTISGMLRICIDDINAGNAEEAVGNLEKLLELSTRNATKVEGVLKLAAIGVDQVDHEAIDLEQIATQLWSEVTLSTSEPPKFETLLSDEVELVSNKQAISTILENLLFNAARYADHDKSESWVRLESRVDRDGIEINVSDNGIGLPESKTNEIFGMFSKLSTRSGDGLGLAIVRRYVDNLGGSVHCKSCEGEWSVFTVRLPKQLRRKTDGADDGSSR